MKSVKPYQRKLSFHKITLENLQSFVEINEIVDGKQFDEWFSYAYPLTDEEKCLLMTLVEPNIIYFDSFTEEELKAKFIIPLLNKIDFRGPKIRDWYERPLKGSYIVSELLTKINGYLPSLKTTKTDLYW